MNDVLTDPSRRELEKYVEENLPKLKEGDIIKGTIVSRVGNNVLVDIGCKSEGVITLDEFTNPEEAQPGKEINVYLEALEDREGQPVISKEKADFMLSWDAIKEKLEKGDKCKATVRKKVKGGLQVEVMGLEAFLPGSQIDVRPVTNFDDFVGKEIDVKIIKVNWAKRNIVVSRRQLLEEARSQKEVELFNKLNVGDIVEGTVKNIVEYGAFIDLGGIDALLHISDISWKKIYHPKEVLNVGEKVKVMVFTKNEETKRITVGMKQMKPHPWENIEEKYPVGSRVKGKITSFTDYGAFMEIEPGIFGLIHVSEMSWTKNVVKPEKILKIGEQVEAIVLSIDKENHKISLGLKQAQPDPWSLIGEKYKIGEKIKGEVKALRQFGAFVEIEEGIEGLVRNADLSWTKRIKHPREILKKGQKIEAIVLNIDKEARRITLGYKHTKEDPFYTFAKAHEAGEVLKVSVIDIPATGVVVQLPYELEGFIPLSFLNIPKKKKPKDVYRIGQEISATIKRIDTKTRKVILTEKPIVKKKKDIKRKPAKRTEHEMSPKKFTLKDHLKGDKKL